MFSWFGILKLVLQIGFKIAEFMKDRQLLDAGEQKAIAKSLVKIQETLEIRAEVEKEIAALTDEEVDKRLEEDFRD